MRITFSARFKAFLEDNSGVYPYTDIKKTRKSFHLEWVMYESDWGRTHNILRMVTEYFPVHVSCWKDKPKRLEELLMEGAVYPLPHEMNEIMDSMHVWGQSVSYFWYCEVLQLMGDWIGAGQQVSKKEMYKEVIEKLVLARIHEHFAIGSLLHNNWEQYFELTYMTRFKTFYQMAGMSKNFIENSINSVYTHGSIVLAPYF